MNAENIRITDPTSFDKIERQITKGGINNLHVIADFDRTLTLAFVNGVPTPSITAILRDHNYLTADYPARAKALYAHYGAIERNPNVPKEEKKKIMEEWWTAHFKILYECGLHRDDIAKAMTSGVVKFRPGVDKFLKLLNENNIPLVIMSASGLGGEAIRKFFEHEKLLFPNIYIIGNEFVWDEKGNAVDIIKPIITGVNKDETLLQSFPVYETIKNRKNVILLGDNFGDTGMIEGFPCNNLLKIGFLNVDVTPENIKHFEAHYDALILNDGPFDFVNNLINKILN
jgi:HAD superfamily hydrolase (TIGR01544 family)